MGTLPILSNLIVCQTLGHYYLHFIGEKIKALGFIRGDVVCAPGGLT